MFDLFVHFWEHISYTSKPNNPTQIRSQLFYPNSPVLLFKYSERILVFLLSLTTKAYSCPSDKTNNNDIGRGPLRSPLSMSKEQSPSNKLACPSCKLLVDVRRTSVDMFEKHVVMCKNTCTNGMYKS